MQRVSECGCQEDRTKRPEAEGARTDARDPIQRFRAGYRRISWPLHPRGRARRGRYALESVAPEVASFGFGITIIEQGGARTEFHDGGARVAKLMPIYHHSFLRRLDPRNGLAPGDQEQMFALGPSRLRLMLLSLAFGGFPEDPVQTDASFEDRRKAPSRGTFRPGRDIYSIFFTRYDHLSKQLI